ncbi:MAG: hypothetical protein KME46_00525 [Brasilonema angustatum HA4187-MV1]|nr:hypothetical protein [Brasilonema angustatum HA4187-MV1]
MLWTSPASELSVPVSSFILAIALSESLVWAIASFECAPPNGTLPLSALALLPKADRILHQMSL